MNQNDFEQFLDILIGAAAGYGVGYLLGMSDANRANRRQRLRDRVSSLEEELTDEGEE